MNSTSNAVAIETLIVRAQAVRMMVVGQATELARLVSIGHGGDESAKQTAQRILENKEQLEELHQQIMRS